MFCSPTHLITLCKVSQPLGWLIVSVFIQSVFCTVKLFRHTTAADFNTIVREPQAHAASIGVTMTTKVMRKLDRIELEKKQQTKWNKVGGTLNSNLCLSKGIVRWC